MPDILIKNATVFFNGFLQSGEIAIDDGKISKISKSIHVTSVNELIDAKGMLVLPAGIDMHVHFRDPGDAQKEDWHSGSMAACHGGITTVIDQPNTNPPTIDVQSFKEKLKLANKKSIIDFGINGGVTNNIESLKELDCAGSIAFGEIFMAESTGKLNIDNETFKKSLFEIKKLNALATIHAEDESIRLAYESLLTKYTGSDWHSKARPEICEIKAIEKAIEYIDLCDVKAHFCHISTKRGVELIHSKNKKNITLEVAPHHLFLSNNDWNSLGTFGKMNPPLRSKETVSALFDFLSKGYIDAIASDHAPHAEFEKGINLKQAPSGVPGVETLIPLLMMAVKKNRISIERMIDVTSKNPAKILGIDGLGKGVFEEGFDADLLIINSKEITKIEGDLLYSKAKWTPYEGMNGIFPKIVISRGKIVYDGEIIGNRGDGKFLNGNDVRLLE
ncbi:MAG: dihydroorotase [Methanosarcinaceae archaeon]|nr:dihydroorotase [Methanosarcinaceae archaeon]NKQ38568.1 dihydroorotase [Methanosarcinales archaeon]